MASVNRSLKHAFREQETPNANAELTGQNTHIGANSVDEGMEKVAALLPQKRRSDAVLAIEYLITASPEAIQGKSREEQDAYFQDALKWLQERHGAKNVVYAGIHRDEATPHLYAYAVPIDADTGRLNAKKWLGGAKALNQMQTEFAAKVGAAHGFDRGIEGSKARHQDIKTWYSGLEKTAKDVTITPEFLKPKVLSKTWHSTYVETDEMVAARVTKAVQNAYSPAVQGAKQAESDRRRAEEAIRTAKALEKRLNAMETALKPLNDLARLDKDKFVSVVRQVGKEVERIKEERSQARSIDRGQRR